MIYSWLVYSKVCTDQIDIHDLCIIGFFRSKRGLN